MTLSELLKLVNTNVPDLEVNAKLKQAIVEFAASTGYQQNCNPPVEGLLIFEPPADGALV